MIRTALAAIAALTAAAQAQAAEVRLCEREVRTTPLSDERGVQSALIQGFAVVNTGDAPVRLTGVHLQLGLERRVLDTRWLLADDIARAIRQAPQVEALTQIFPSQFCNGALLAGARLAASDTLAPGEAVVFMHQPFAWRGRRDRLEVVVQSERDGIPREDTVARPIAQGTARTEALFPVMGRSFAAAGASFHSHHRWAGLEEFAYDILKLSDNGSTFRGDGTRLSDYAAFGQPVRAVASGTVVAASDGEPDNAAMLKRPDETNDAYFARLLEGQMALLSRGMAAVLGNHVVIDHGNGEYSIYAHLKQGSVTARVGEALQAGATIGALGSSGNSTEPHLHFQMCDGPDIATCRPIPVNFVGYRLPFEYAPRTIQSGDIVETTR